MKIVIDKCYGEYSLSEEAIGRLVHLGLSWQEAEDLAYGITIESRTHPLVIQVVEELGSQGASRSSILKIVELPDDIDLSTLYISDYDGAERVVERHRTWS